MLFGKEAAAVGINLREVSIIYGEAYTQAQKQRPWWEKITPQIGWITAAVMAFLLLLGGALKKSISKRLEQANENIFNKLAGHRLFQRKALRRYKQALINQYSQFKIPFGTERFLDMAKIYVPLKIKEKGDLAGARNLNDNIDGEENVEKEEIEGLETLIRFKRVVIVGAPGSGKSMLLRHITLSYARNISNDLPKQTIPVLLKLSRFNDSDKSVEDHIADVFDSHGFPHANNFIRQGLNQGTLLLLFDGLDEVDSNKRQQVATRIKDFLERDENIQCQAAITCRTAVYGNELNDAVEQTLELVEFSDQQIRQLLTSWPAMPPGKSAEQLILALRERPNIMSLARNPLLLTIVAFLYTDAVNFVLPYSRTEFYEQAIDVLLQLKNEYNHYKKSQKDLVLQRLALVNQDSHGTQDQNRVTFDLKTALKEVKDLLPELNLENKDADLLLDEIVKRSGLLLELDGGKLYQFTHLTLQEFFAASALAQDSAGLLERFKKDQAAWRETVKLWCGLGHDSTRFIKTLYNENPLLALECLSDAQKIKPEVAEDIINEYKSRFGTATEDGEAITLTFGAIASGPTVRSKSVLAFLIDTLNTDGERRIAAAIALSHTNQPSAVKPLSPYFHTIPEVQQAFKRMGDLAVPRLKEFADDGDVQALSTLQGIGTPQAANALAGMLWHQDDVFASKAAWCLATLLSNTTIETSLRHYPLPESSKARPGFKWIWEPFNEDFTSSLPTICGRIGHLMYYPYSADIPTELSSKADKRIIIPLVIQNISELKLNVGVIASLPSTPEFDAVLKDIGRRSEDTFVKFENESEAKNKFISPYFRERLLKEAFKVLSERKKDIDGFNKLQGLKLQFTKELLKTIKAARPNYSKFGRFIEMLSPELQFDLLRRLFVTREPTISDWSNIFRPIKYKFSMSWHYMLIVCVIALLTVISLFSISSYLLQSPTLASWPTVILSLSAMSLLTAWLLFLTKGILFENRSAPSSLVICLLGFVLFPIVLGIVLTDLIRREPLDFKAVRLSQLLAIAGFTPSIGYFSTMEMLKYLTAKQTFAIWSGLIILLSLIAWIGRRKEIAARNPLHGILEKRGPRDHNLRKRRGWFFRRG